MIKTSYANAELRVIATGLPSTTTAAMKDALRGIDVRIVGAVDATDVYQLSPSDMGSKVATALLALDPVVSEWPPKNTPHGPARRGRGGKVKRW